MGCAGDKHRGPFCRPPAENTACHSATYLVQETEFRCIEVRPLPCISTVYVSLTQLIILIKGRKNFGRYLPQTPVTPTSGRRESRLPSARFALLGLPPMHSVTRHPKFESEVPWSVRINRYSARHVVTGLRSELTSSSKIKHQRVWKNQEPEQTTHYVLHHITYRTHLKHGIR